MNFVHCHCRIKENYYVSGTGQSAIRKFVSMTDQCEDLYKLEILLSPCFISSHLCLILSVQILAGTRNFLSICLIKSLYPNPSKPMIILWTQVISDHHHPCESNSVYRSVLSGFLYSLGNSHTEIMIFTHALP
jgi:hypothetical protein